MSERVIVINTTVTITTVENDNEKSKTEATKYDIYMAERYSIQCE